MVERYMEEIKQQKRILILVSLTLKKISSLYENSKNANKIGKQIDLFSSYLEVSESRDIPKYNKKTNQNIENITDYFYSQQGDLVLKSLRADRREFSYKEIEIISSIFRSSTKLSVIINNLSKLYIGTLNKINQLERYISQEQARISQMNSREENNVVEVEKKSVDEIQSKNDKIDRNADMIINGPRKKSLIERMQGKDVDINDMKYLYGLALDILILMNEDQYVDVNDRSYDDKTKFENVSISSVMSNEALQIYNKYGVSSLEGLLNKYEGIRNAYYNNYVKLNSNQQMEYEFSRVNKFGAISSSLSVDFGLLRTALQNENFKFPPSREELINLMNRRILNGKHFEFIEPSESENVSQSEPKSHSEYDDGYKYYKNLTKNMTEEDIAKLYSKVIMELNGRIPYMEVSEKVKEGYYVILQELFCRLIMEKQGKRFLDSKQYKEELMKIAQNVLKEQVKFSVYGYNDVSKEEQQERKQTIYEEYIKYLASLQNKQDAMKFAEFAKVKYGMTNSSELTQYYEQQQDESVRRGR